MCLPFHPYWVHGSLLGKHYKRLLSRQSHVLCLRWLVTASTRLFCLVLLKFCWGVLSLGLGLIDTFLHFPCNFVCISFLHSFYIVNHTRIQLFFSFLFVCQWLNSGCPTSRHMFSHWTRHIPGFIHLWIQPSSSPCDEPGFPIQSTEFLSSSHWSVLFLWWYIIWC